MPKDRDMWQSLAYMLINSLKFLGFIKCVKFPGVAAEVFCSQEWLCYISLFIVFQIFLNDALM